MAKIGPALQSNKPRQQQDSEPDYNAPIDAEAIKATAAAMIDGDDLAPITTEDIPESPGAANLARYQDEIASRIPERKPLPTKLFGRPSSSGDGQAAPTFTFASAKPPSFQMARGPMHPGFAIHKQTSDTGKSVKAQHQPYQEQPSGSQTSQSGANPGVTKSLASQASQSLRKRSYPITDEALRSIEPENAESKIAMMPHAVSPPERAMDQLTHPENATVIGPNEQLEPDMSQDCSFDFAPRRFLELKRNQKQQKKAISIEDTQTSPEATNIQMTAKYDMKNSLADAEQVVPGQKIVGPLLNITAPGAGKAPLDDNTPLINHSLLSGDMTRDAVDGNDVTQQHHIQGVEETGHRVTIDMRNISGPKQSITSQDLGSSRPSKSHTPLTTPKGSQPVGVRKPQYRPRTKARLSVDERPSVPHPAASEPSAEELLFLVMRRTRMKEQAERQLLMRQQELEADNEKLHQDRQNFQNSLDAAHAREAQLVSNLKTRQAEVGVYRSRFDKLKTWAKSMSKNYEDLQKQSIVMAESQKALSTAKEEVQAEVREVQALSSKSLTSLERMKSDVSSIRNQVHPLEKAVLAAQVLAQERDEQLFNAQERCYRFESHISELTTVQNKYNHAVVREQRGTGDRLKRVEEMLQIVQADLQNNLKQQPGVEQCLAFLETLTKRQQVGPENLESLQNALVTISDKLVTYHNLSAESLECSTTAITNLRNDVLTQIITVVDSLRPDISKREEVSNLERQNSRLEEQVRARNDVLEEVRRGIDAAKAREISVQKSTEEVLKSFAEGTEINTQAKAKQEEPVAVTLGGMTMKYCQLSSECLTQRTRADENAKIIQEKGDEIQKLKEQATKAEADCVKLRGDLSNTQEQSEVRALQIKNNLDRQLVEKDDQLRRTEEILESSNQKISDALAEIERYQSIHAEQHDQLEKARSGTDAAVQDYIQANEEIIQLKSQILELIPFRDKAATVPVLYKDLETQSLTISELRARCARFDEVLRQNSSLKDEVATKASELGVIATQLSTLRGEAARVPVLCRDLEVRGAAVAELEARCAEFDEVQRRNSALKDEIATKVSEVKALEKQLQDVQETKQYICHLQQQLSAADEQVNNVKCTLTEAQAKAERLEALEEQLRLKTTEIHSLKSEVTTLNNTVAKTQQTAARVAPLEERLQGKGAELDSLKSKFTAMSGALIKAQETAGTVAPLQDELRNRVTETETLRSEVAALTSSLNEARQNAARVAPLSDDLRHKSTEVESLASKVDVLNSTLKGVQERAARVAPLEEILQSKSTEIESLAHKLAEAEKLSLQVHELKEVARTWQTTFDDLGRELEQAKAAAERCRTPEAKRDRQNTEMSEVGDHLAAASEELAAISKPQEDLKAKASEIAALRQKIAVLEEDSPEVSESYQEDHEVPENFPSQETILSLDQFIIGNDTNEFPMGGSQTRVPTESNLGGANKSQRKVADRSSTRRPERGRRPAAPTAGLDLAAGSVNNPNRSVPFLQENTLASVSAPQSTQQTNRIPDSQFESTLATNIAAVKDSQEVSKPLMLSSSSLSDIADTFSSSESEKETETPRIRPTRAKARQQFADSAKSSMRRQGDERSLQTPSSSHGETMLLEDLERTQEEPLTKDLAKRFRNNPAASDRPNYRSPWKDGQQPPRHSMPLGRAGNGTNDTPHDSPSSPLVRIPRATPLAERSSSQMNAIPSSPVGVTKDKERYQPNSAAKRQVEPEATSFTGDRINKRLKRMPENLEVKNSAKDVSATTPSRRHEIPSGSRKGSIIGTNAPPPGKVQRGKTTRKGSKDQRYSTRFRQEG